MAGASYRSQKRFGTMSSCVGSPVTERDSAGTFLWNGKQTQS